MSEFDTERGSWISRDPQVMDLRVVGSGFQSDLNSTDHLGQDLAQGRLTEVLSEVSGRKRKKDTSAKTSPKVS